MRKGCIFQLNKARIYLYKSLNKVISKILLCGNVQMFWHRQNSYFNHIDSFIKIPQWVMCLQSATTTKFYRDEKFSLVYRLQSLFRNLQRRNLVSMERDTLQTRYPLWYMVRFRGFESGEPSSVPQSDNLISQVKPFLYETNEKQKYHTIGKVPKSICNSQ